MPPLDGEVSAGWRKFGEDVDGLRAALGLPPISSRRLGGFNSPFFWLTATPRNSSSILPAIMEPRKAALRMSGSPL
jgi:hypothetical protein